MRLRWLKRKGPRFYPSGFDYYDGYRLYARVSPLIKDCCVVSGWYWVAGWGGREVGVVYKNTCETPCDTPEEAKAQAAKYVKQCLARKAPSDK